MFLSCWGKLQPNANNTGTLRLQRCLLLCYRHVGRSPSWLAFDLKNKFSGAHLRHVGRLPSWLALELKNKFSGAHLRHVGRSPSWLTFDLENSSRVLTYAMLWKTLTTSSSFSRRSRRPLTSSCSASESSRVVSGMRSNLKLLISRPLSSRNLEMGP